MNGGEEARANKPGNAIRCVETINIAQMTATPIVRRMLMGNQSPPLLIEELSGLESRRSFVLLLWLE